MNGRRVVCNCNGFLLLVDPWPPTMNSQSIAFSLFPYHGFLYIITKSNTAPRLTLFGFCFLLAFVGATIPAGIYAKVHYGTSLSNFDWLHGGAESLLTLTNLFIVLGLRNALRKSGKNYQMLPLERKKTTRLSVLVNVKLYDSHVHNSIHGADEFTRMKPLVVADEPLL